MRGEAKMNTHQDRASLGVALGGIVFVAVMSIAIGRGNAAQAQERFSVWDGVYSEEEATRGKEEYDYNCSPCHIHDLSGDSIKDVPALAGEDFLAEWSGKSVQELLEYMSTNMPPDSRGSLGEKTYVDVASYVLQANKFPAGTNALGSDSARLAKTFIDREPQK
jgi:mono/diheme cytochrome c family protein